MRSSRFSPEQVVQILKEAEATPLAEVCRRHGISAQTFYRWKTKYGGMEISDARRLKQLEDENRRLRQAVADLTLDNQALSWCSQKSSDARRSAGGRTPRGQ